ncbi:MAG: sodium:proton antiporter [Gammaproteobacteria bacterium RIFCSPHIGHO2_12_FULL_40_19]|nr:MAG: sodium:proton antiporter [Gammaproteobacteria bacterium RIFCSPHIGHO2_12_FULL_40_19]
MLYTVIVPLIFFSVANAIVNIGELKRLRKILMTMMGTFLFTGSIAAIFMIGVVILFPPTQGVVLKLTQTATMQSINIGEQITNMLTVPDLTKLFLPDNMLALIFVAILVGVATTMTGEKGKPFADFLQAGAEIFMKLITLIMYYAPIGFFAFFAVLVAKLGPTLFESYFRSTIIYYAAGVVYFIGGFTFFAFLANKKTGIQTFWKNVTAPAMTALATCSSAASIPVNLQAVRNMHVSSEINETVIPLGTILHKQGSILGGVLKIAFLFGIFHMHFLTPFALCSTWLVAILVGTVMGAIPSGGMLGEMLILSVYGFPPQALFIIATISIIIDPLATVLNVVGNTVSALLITRFVNWFELEKEPRMKLRVAQRNE